MPTATRTRITQDSINELIAKRVDRALKAYDAARNLRIEAEIENDQQDDHVEENVNHGNGNGNGNGNPNGMEGVVGLTRWFKKMETVFYISNCPPRYQLKYATCALLDGALTWWNSHKRTVGVNDAYAMMWKDTVEKYIGGLPNSIQGNVIASEPVRLQDAIRIANNLMGQKLKGYAIMNAENKRRFNSSSRDNHGQQQQPFKRQNVSGQNVARAYTVENNAERKGYARVLPYCSKCRMHHEGLCMVKYGHYRNECPKLRNQNCGNKIGNKTGNNEAKARAYAIGGGGASPDSNVITYTTLLDVIPSTLDTSYAIKLADGRISETNVILRGCTLGLLGHPFDIDLMPVELSSFDVIVGMDWLVKHHAVIVCDERIVRIPYGDKVLIIEGNGCKGGSKSKLSIISCTKTQKYIQMGCPLYLAQVAARRSDDKPEDKPLEDVPIVWDFSEVFPEDLPGLPPTRQVKFQIELVPGAAPIA
ncbi:putative reverse transcriptase domain-containing protein [Tanacetum coccineum]